MNFLIDDVIFQYSKSNYLLARWELFLSALRLTGSSVNISILSRTGRLDKNADEVIYTRPFTKEFLHSDIVQISTLAKTVQNAFFISSYSTHCYTAPSAAVISAQTPSLNFLVTEPGNTSEPLVSWAGYHTLIATDKHSIGQIKKMKPDLDPILVSAADFGSSNQNQLGPAFDNPFPTKLLQNAIKTAVENCYVEEERGNPSTRKAKSDPFTKRRLKIRSFLDRQKTQQF